MDYPDKFRSSITSILIFSTLLLFTVSCDIFGGSDGNNGFSNGSDDDDTFLSGPWLIPQDEIRDGGPGVDGIPSIDNPDFASVSEIDFIPDDRMVIGIKIDGVARAYPHQILDWHEIVNDQIGDHSFTITFCPLTGTGMCWNRKIEDEVTEFGVSGLLFRNNLIMYDRKTFSAYSQMQLRGVNGKMIETNIETYPVIETTWKTWKEMYPESNVHTRNTGHFRNYSGYAYGSDYATNHDRILFRPLVNSDDRLQNKDRVLGIIDSQNASIAATVKVFVIEQFGEGINLVKTHVGSSNYLVVGSTEYNFAAAFKPESDHASLQFQPVQGQLPVVLEDNEGNLWDLYGQATEGPRQGEHLQHARSYIGYWFAWADFFPTLDIYEGE